MMIAQKEVKLKNKIQFFQTFINTVNIYWTLVFTVSGVLNVLHWDAHFFHICKNYCSMQ